MRERLSVLLHANGDGDLAVLREALDACTLDLDIEQYDDRMAAMDALKSKPFDCALLSCGAQDAVGLIVLDEARAAGVSTPIVIIADVAEGMSANSMVRAGAADFVPRQQVSPEIMCRVVNYAVRTYRAEVQAAQAEEALQYMAFYDALTKLPNRALFLDRLEQSIGAARRENNTVALLMMDLNRFKEVNDTLGHHYGDLLLREVGRRFKTALRESDTVARLGGDEFAALLPTGATIGGARQTAAKIIDALDAPFTIDGNRFEIGISIGIAQFPEHGGDTDTLLRHADIAMYMAKRSGIGVSVFTKEFNQHSLGQLILKSELRYAIEHDELRLHYQPKVDVLTGRVAGVEALVRWRHPQHGLIPPDEFIPLAEQTRLIESLTMWVLREGLAQCGRWEREDGFTLNVAINLSARALHDVEFSGQVKSLLEEFAMPPRRLVLEVTESAVMTDAAPSKQILDRLHDMGVRISIDDFGTGYSSLAHLKKLPIDEVKIDKSFVSSSRINGDDAVIVRAIIDLGRRLGLRVVAEGVEDAATWNFLRRHGCDAAQGFFMSRPLDAEALVAWLRQSPWGLRGVA